MARAAADAAPETTDPAPDPAAEVDTAADTAAEGETTEQAVPATRLAWSVIYPAVSVLPKDADGNVIGDFVTVTKGQTLPVECEWQGPTLRTLGMVVGITAPA